MSAPHDKDGGAAGLGDTAHALAALAERLGMHFHPVDFEVVPSHFMTEIAVYGLPVRMAHWSFGVRYIHQLIRQGMGHSRIFEVMFPGDPCHAYLVSNNSLAENTLVAAHVIGHADFARRNHLFLRHQAMAGGRILQQAAARARRIDDAMHRYGTEAVEAVLDAALALEPHVDIHQPLHRSPYPVPPPPGEPPSTAAAGGNLQRARTPQFTQRYRRLPGEAAVPLPAAEAPQIPPRPESDLLWFIARHAPAMAGWERDIFLAVREESFYFYPVFACQIMNEGWACYWHARLLREADFLPADLYLDALRAHSDVVRPFAGEQQLALAVNPYHLGFCMWERIVERQGVQAARRICAEEDDFGFVRNHLDAELAAALDLFAYEAHEDGEIRIAARDIHAVREAILAPRYNYGAPRIAVTRLGPDGSLELRHDAAADGRGLDMARAEQVLEYIARVWRRPITLETVSEAGNPRSLHAGSARH